MISIQASYAHLVQPFLGKEPTRCYLQGFYVEAAPQGGVFIVATDGHRMAVFHDETGTADAPAIIKLDKATASRCKSPARDIETARRLLISDDGNATVTYKDEPEAMQPKAVLDGWSFPNWRRIVPTNISEDTAVTSYNPKYLGDFTAIAKGSRKSGSIIIHNNKAAGGAAVILTGRQDFIGVLMPVAWRDNPVPRQFPFDITGMELAIAAD